MRIANEIYNEILAGHTYTSITQHYCISERTFYRYLDIIFANEDAILSEADSIKEMKRQQKLCRDGLREDMQRMLVISSDPNHRLAVEAQHLASEIRCTILKTYAESPSALAHNHTFRHIPFTDNKGNTGLRLVEIKDPVTRLPLKYEVMSGSSEEEDEETYEGEEETEAEKEEQPVEEEEQEDEEEQVS